MGFLHLEADFCAHQPFNVDVTCENYLNSLQNCFFVGKVVVNLWNRTIHC